MVSVEAIIGWLRPWLEGLGSDLTAAYLFGSSLDDSRNPNDIDLALVTPDGAGGPSWLRIIDAVSKLQPTFHKFFGLPLSAMVLTPSEWQEVDGVIVRERTLLL